METKYSLGLTRFLDECPKCWENFIEDLTKDDTNWDSYGKAVIVSNINIALQEYNAEYNRDIPEVVFETEEDFLFFKLKFAYYV